MAEFTPVARIADFAASDRHPVLFDGRSVLILRVGNDFFAIEDICSHDGQPLTDGALCGTEIECPRHGAKFDIKTGAALCMPAIEPIAKFELKVVGDEIFLR